MKVRRNLFLSTCIAAILLSAPILSPAQELYEGVRTIVLDPGHGGKDPGCHYGNYKEKDITLSVALMLGEMIRREMPEVKVVYTRDKDVAVALDRRGKIANDAQADLFVSIHVNAVEPPTKPPSGALTLIMGKENEGRNLDMAMKENQVISFEDDYTAKYKDYLSGSAEMFIIYSLYQYVNIEQSLRLANMIQGRVKSSTPIPDKGIRRQKLLVLWYTTMPGVLVELGFIDNEHDRKVLITNKGQRQMATALFNAIKEYKQQVESSGRLKAEEGQGSMSMPAQGRPEAADTQAAPKRTEQKPAAKAKQKSGVTYMVQILSTSKKIPRNSSELKSYRGKATEKYTGGRYRYYVGECYSYSEVVELQREVRRSFPDAFTVAFRNGKQITVPEARKLTE